MRIILVITKTDLESPSELINAYKDLVSEIICIAKGDDLTLITAELINHITVLVGSSGVGKSTLVNSLLPDAARRTGSVNEVTGRGRHTSTSAFALPLSPAGWIIDTPGIRSFGIAHVSTKIIENSFTDLTPYLSNCLKSCQHLQTDCGLAEIAPTDLPLIKRADSLRRLITSTTS